MQKRKYTAEFKQGAMDLAQQLGNVAKAAEQLGIGDTLIHNWRKRAQRQSLNPTGGSSSSGSGSGTRPPASSESSEELARLRRENQELKKVNQILKAAAAFFSQDHLK